MSYIFLHRRKYFQMENNITDFESLKNKIIPDVGKRKYLFKSHDICYHNYDKIKSKIRNCYGAPYNVV